MGTCGCRYIGVRDPVAVDRPGVMAAIAERRITTADVDAFNNRRLGGGKPGGGNYPVMAAIPGVTRRILGPHEGLSRTYCWGPEPWRFVLEVEPDDWAAIKALPEAAHFEEEND